MVVNRLPQDSVRARVKVDQRAVRGRALVRTVSGRRFTSSNDVGHLHSVRLHHSWMRTRGQDLVRTFPPASTTLLRIRLR